MNINQSPQAAYGFQTGSWMLGLLLLLSVLSVPSEGKNIKDQAVYLEQVRGLDKAALYLQRADGAERINVDKKLVPASSLKLITAYLAIERWGIDHRFSTDFYWHKQCLWIKGSGDPFVTSEEITAIVKQLKKYINVDEIRCLGVDTSLFPDIKLHGRGASDNPYDAGNSAFAVNFNSINVRRVKTGIVSAEPQTPITPLAKSVVRAFEQRRGRLLSTTAFRMSIPGGQAQSAQYGAEVFSLIALGRVVPIKHEQVSPAAKLVYRHKSSKSLAELIQAMMKYSNNYIANQLYLLIPPALEEIPGSKVSSSRSQQYALSRIKALFAWSDFEIFDGAGLSRRNQITARQLAELLEKFRPWRALLSSYRGKRVFAKTGTMKDISSFAGYYRDKKNRWNVFVFIANDFSDQSFRMKLVKVL